MPLFRGSANPFYFILIATGTVFCVTAIAYTVMTVQGIHGVDPGSVSQAGKWLNQTLDRHGVVILGIELSALAVFSMAAVATDRYWLRQDPDTSLSWSHDRSGTPASRDP